MHDMKALLLAAPDGHLSEPMKALIERWEGEPTALQLLELMDHATYYAGASGFLMRALNVMLDVAMEEEGTTLEQLVLLAVWRNALLTH